MPQFSDFRKKAVRPAQQPAQRNLLDCRIGFICSQADRRAASTAGDNMALQHYTNDLLHAGFQFFLSCFYREFRLFRDFIRR